jgi:hypothetical protein
VVFKTEDFVPEAVLDQQLATAASEPIANELDDRRVVIDLALELFGVLQPKCGEVGQLKAKGFAVEVLKGVYVALL